MPSWAWNVLAHIKREYNFIMIGAGDWGQLPPVEEENIDFENSWIVKYMFNHCVYELVEVKRSNDKELLKDARAIRKNEKIDYSTYGTQEHPTALCFTNDAVNAINQKWNDYYAKQHKKQKI